MELPTNLFLPETSSQQIATSFLLFKPKLLRSSMFLISYHSAISQQFLLALFLEIIQYLFLYCSHFYPSQWIQLFAALTVTASSLASPLSPPSPSLLFRLHLSLLLLSISSSSTFLPFSFVFLPIAPQNKAGRLIGKTQIIYFSLLLKALQRLFILIIL